MECLIIRLSFLLLQCKRQLESGASSIDSNIKDLKENSVTRNQMLEEKAKVMEELNQRHNKMSDRVTRVEEKFTFIEKSLNRIELMMEGKN